MEISSALVGPNTFATTLVGSPPGPAILLNHQINTLALRWNIPQKFANYVQNRI